MKERPILFSAPMVRAILDGKKTVTRRVVKREHAPNPGHDWAECLCREIDPTDTPCVICDARFGACPYGVAGDQLWVRETFTYIRGNGVRLHYRADGEPLGRDGQVLPTDGGDRRWMPSIHMHRAASRIQLEVVSVRVERLHEVTDDDARAEGLSCLTKDGKTYKFGIPDADGLPGNDNDGQHWCEWETSPREAFRKLWDTINAARGHGWASNPWVWRIEFARVPA